MFQLITSGAAGAGDGVGLAGVGVGEAGVGVGLAGVGVGVTSGDGAAQPKPPISNPKITSTLTIIHIPLFFTLPSLRLLISNTVAYG